MNSKSKSPVSSNFISKKPNGKDVISSADPTNLSCQTCVPSGKSVSVDSMTKKRDGKGIVFSDVPSKTEELLFFKDVKLGQHEGQLRFRLIHYWEARNPYTKTLIGLEMLLVDEQVYSDMSFFCFACLIKILSGCVFFINRVL